MFDQVNQMKNTQHSMNYNFDFEGEAPILQPNPSFNYTKLNAKDVNSMYQEEIACETKRFIEISKPEIPISFRDSMATQAATNDERLSTFGNYSVLTTERAEQFRISTLPTDERDRSDTIHDEPTVLIQVRVNNLVDSKVMKESPLLLKGISSDDLK